MKPTLRDALKAVTDELESVWKNIGQTSPNRHVTSAREVLADMTSAHFRIILSLTLVAVTIAGSIYIFTH